MCSLSCSSRIIFHFGSNRFRRGFGRISSSGLLALGIRSNMRLCLVKVEEFGPSLIAHSLLHVLQPKDVDSEVSIIKVLVAVLNHEAWRRIEIVVVGVLRIVSVKG